MDKSVRIFLLVTLSIAFCFFLYRILFANNEVCNLTGFHIDRTTIVEGETIIVTDSSANSGNRLWKFDDGSENGTEISMKHTYKKPGEYKLILSINNDCQIDTLIKVLPSKQNTGKFEGANINSPDKANMNTLINFSTNKTGFETYDWTFGENGVSNIDKSVTNSNSVQYKYSTPGKYLIYLTINKIHTITKNITILPTGSTGNGPSESELKSQFEILFLASGKPTEIKPIYEKILKLLCNNKSIKISFSPPLVSNSTSSSTSVSFSELGTKLRMVTHYQKVEILELKKHSETGNCPDSISLKIKQ